MKECGCPEWIERCAHFDGEWIAMHHGFERTDIFSVCRGKGLVSTGNYYYHEESVGVTYDDHDAAVAAFHAAEAELLEVAR